MHIYIPLIKIQIASEAVLEVDQISIPNGTAFCDDEITFVCLLKHLLFVSKLNLSAQKKQDGSDKESPHSLMCNFLDQPAISKAMQYPSQVKVS